MKGAMKKVIYNFWLRVAVNFQVLKIQIFKPVLVKTQSFRQVAFRKH